MEPITSMISLTQFLKLRHGKKSLKAGASA